MSGLVAFHVMSLGVWLGIITVELLYEVAGFRGDLDPIVVARLHRWTDRYLEGPMLVLVLTSGALLWERTGFDREVGGWAARGLARLSSHARSARISFA